MGGNFNMEDHCESSKDKEIKILESKLNEALELISIMDDQLDLGQYVMTILFFASCDMAKKLSLLETGEMLPIDKITIPKDHTSILKERYTEQCIKGNTLVAEHSEDGTFTYRFINHRKDEEHAQQSNSAIEIPSKKH